MAVFYANLGVWKKAGRGWLLIVVFFGNDAGCVVLSESFLGSRGIIHGLTDHLESLVDFPCLVGAAVLENKLVNCELSVLATKKPDR